MKAYKTPRIKTIKLDTEELMAASDPTLTSSENPVGAEAARSKRHTGLFDDSDDEGYAD